MTCCCLWFSQPARETTRNENGSRRGRIRAAYHAQSADCLPRQNVNRVFGHYGGGKVLYTKSRRVRNRVALALRLRAYSLHHANNYLCVFFRRINRKLGKAQAITATAHKLARIVFHLLSTKQPYDESVFQRCEQDAPQRAEL
jgi:hypothetical protein